MASSLNKSYEQQKIMIESEDESSSDDELLNMRVFDRSKAKAAKKKIILSSNKQPSTTTKKKTQEKATKPLTSEEIEAQGMSVCLYVSLTVMSVTISPYNNE